MNTEAAERHEETIASVRSDLELRHQEALEAKRVAKKRELLEAVVRGAREIDTVYEAAKAHKKALKDVRNDLIQMDADNLDLEDLERLLGKIGGALGYHTGGSIGVAIAVTAQPPFPTQPAPAKMHPSDDPSGYGRKRAR